VKRQVLTTKIAKAAREARLSWTLAREGKRHEVWQCGETAVSIPRHREINEITAQAIQKQLEKELGEGWWR
jgi:hypothetical protein